MKSADRHFVLVYGSLETGGIETLIVRFASFLVEHDCDVTVCYTDGRLVDLLDHRVRLVPYVDTRDLLYQLKSVGAGGESTVLLSFDPISAARALLVEVEGPGESNVRHISGVFHPRAYFMTGERFYRRALDKIIARAVGFSNLFFMNRETRESHALRWKADLSGSALIPLPISERSTDWQPSLAPTLRIVSVGRLVDFKGYNLGAAAIVAECRAAGVPVTWDIYGTGPLEQEVQRKIAEHSVQEFVRLRGELPYSEFAGTVGEYDLFIGVGTAALEAAVMGVPTLCATDTDQQLCYGYLHELPFGNLGELQPEPPSNRFASLIMQHAVMDAPQRLQLSCASRSTALKYAMPEFFRQLMLVVEQPGYETPRSFRRAAGLLYRACTEGPVVNAVRARIHASRR